MVSSENLEMYTNGFKVLGKMRCGVIFKGTDTRPCRTLEDLREFYCGGTGKGWNKTCNFRVLVMVIAGGCVQNCKIVLFSTMFDLDGHILHYGD